MNHRHAVVDRKFYRGDVFEICGCGMWRIRICGMQLPWRVA
jgi:hypothetical protein